MNPLLCNHAGFIMLCYASDDGRGATISAGRDGDWAAHGFRRSPGSPFDWIKIIRSVDGTRFFPTVLWRGTPVSVEMWSDGHGRPAVGCSVSLYRIDQQRWFGRTGLTSEQMIEPCRMLGWRVDIMDGAAYRVVPIDELELIEGPPPEGVF